MARPSELLAGPARKVAAGLVAAALLAGAGTAAVVAARDTGAAGQDRAALAAAADASLDDPAARSGAAASFQASTTVARPLEPASEPHLDRVAVDAGAGQPGEPTFAAGVHEPRRLVIDELDVNAPVMPVGLTSDGGQQVPADHRVVGWYEPLGPFDGTGSNVLVAHVDWRGNDGVFHDLATLQSGDRVTVVLGGGQSATYAVSTVTDYRKDRTPLGRLYDPTGSDELVLITCGGPFNRRVGHYRDNTVVVSTPVR